MRDKWSKLKIVGLIMKTIGSLTPQEVFLQKNSRFDNIEQRQFCVFPRLRCLLEISTNNRRLKWHLKYTFTTRKLLLCYRH